MILSYNRELQAVPDIWSLYDWCNWLTPAGYIKRFDTAFYMCCLDYVKDTLEDFNPEVKKVFVRWLYNYIGIIKQKT